MERDGSMYCMLSSLFSLPKCGKFVPQFHNCLSELLDMVLTECEYDEKRRRREDERRGEKKNRKLFQEGTGNNMKGG